MRCSLLLSGLVAIALPCACSNEAGRRTNEPPGSISTGGGTLSLGATGGSTNLGIDGGSPTHEGDITITSIRLDPADAVIDVAPGASGSETYRVLAAINGGAEEDITYRTVFDVPDNWLVGTFPGASKPVFMTSTKEPRGGKLTVRAAAANSDGSIAHATTSLTVRFAGHLPDARIRYGGAGPALPANPASLFAGPSSPSRSPQIVYPSDGVMMPPNVGRIDVHFLPGVGNTVLPAPGMK